VSLSDQTECKNGLRTYADCSSNLSPEFQPAPAPVDSKKYRKLPAVRMSQN